MVKLSLELIILMLSIVPKVPDCIINCFLLFVKQFASTLIVKVVIILLHNGLFLVHVDFHVARYSTRFFCYLCPSAFSFVLGQPFTTGVTEPKVKPPNLHIFYFSWSRCREMFLHGSVNLAHSYHRRQPTVGARPWPVFPASSQFVPNQPYESCFRDFSSTSWSFIFASMQ